MVILTSRVMYIEEMDSLYKVTHSGAALFPGAPAHTHGIMTSTSMVAAIDKVKVLWHKDTQALREDVRCHLRPGRPSHTVSSTQTGIP